MYSRGTLDLKAIRAELGLNQFEFARLIGVSPRVIQSCEQRWRNPSPSVEKSALLALMAHRNGRRLVSEPCWKATNCPQNLRKGCMAYWLRLGTLCWFVTGTFCKGAQRGSWAEKMAICQKCSFFRTLLPGEIPVKDALPEDGRKRRRRE